MDAFTLSASTNGFTATGLSGKVAALKASASGIVSTTANLFDETAWFVYNLIFDADLLKEFVLMVKKENETKPDSEKIKIPVLIRDQIGDTLTDKETKAVGKAKKEGSKPNFFLFIYRVIFGDNDGTLRSFENHAYPARYMCETAFAGKINTKSDFVAIRTNATATSKDGKALKGIEAMRQLDKEKHSNGPRASSKPAETTPAKPTIPAEAVAFTGIGAIAKAVAAKVTFDGDGWAIIAIHKDGDTTRGMFNVEVEDDQRNAMIAAAYEKAKASSAKAPLTKTITDKSQIGFNERAPA